MISQMWPVDKTGVLVSIAALPQTLPDLSALESWTEAVWRGWPVTTVRVEQGKVLLSGLLFIQPPWTPRCSPLSLHMEEGSRSFAVWWRCVLTQRGDEDGILIGLIELMVLSPLVGEECQASLWLCASWLLSACCSCDLNSISLSLSLIIFCLPTLQSVFSSSCSLSFPVLYLFILRYCPNR